jgi:hypothetical protein
MRNKQRFLAVCALVGACIAVAQPAQARTWAPPQSPGPACGGTLWKLMTLSDPGRTAVKWPAAATTVGDIAKLTAPAKVPATRSTPFQRQIWQLTAVIDRFRVASNGEIVLVLYDVPSATYMDAYIPAESCLPKTTRGRAQILAARKTLLASCAAPTTPWQQVGATVQLTGAGFWNPARNTKGALPTGAELRPVTGLSVLQGCGK